MDERTQIEYDRIKAGPHEGYFTFVHHQGPVVEYSDNVMERVTDILSGRSDKPEWQQYDRLRHIYWLDPVKIPAIAQVQTLWDAYNAQVKALWDAFDAQEKPLRDACNTQEKPLRDEILVYLRLLIPDCRWDGKTIFGKQ